MYPYHNKIKQRINNGELVDYYYDTRKNIGECLVLVFNTIPFERPIRPHRFEMYQPILEKWEKEQNSKNEEKGENDMNELQIKNENKVLTSMEVAEMVEKEHRKLLRDIRTYIEQLAETKIGLGDFFLESSYIDKNNQERPCYLITKKGCEFIANKLTGKKGTIFTATYINRFNEMEEQITKPKSTMEILRLEFQAIEEIGARVDKVQNDLEDFKLEMPLLAVDIEKLQKAKNRIAVGILGRKDSQAYKDASLRSRLYSDLNRDFKRQFNIDTYKALKRCELDKAIQVIEAYKPPLYLVEEIEAKNGQLMLV